MVKSIAAFGVRDQRPPVSVAPRTSTSTPTARVGSGQSRVATLQPPHGNAHFARQPPLPSLEWAHTQRGSRDESGGSVTVGAPELGNASTVM